MDKVSTVYEVTREEFDTIIRSSNRIEKFIVHEDTELWPGVNNVPIARFGVKWVDRDRIFWLKRDTND